MNWKSIIQDLCSSGLTQAQIASEVGVKQPTIAGILSGAQKDMRWANGERLRTLHARLLQRPPGADESAALGQAVVPSAAIPVDDAARTERREGGHA